MNMIDLMPQSSKNGLTQDWHALAQITPILYQSVDSCACNLRTSVLKGDLPKCLDGGRSGHRQVDPVPTHGLSDASPSSILCHSVANPVPIRCQSCANLIPIRPLMADWSWIGIGLGPSSIKTREVLGNPSLMPKRFPETRKISRGKSWGMDFPIVLMEDRPNPSLPSFPSHLIERKYSQKTAASVCAKNTHVLRTL